ncbi:unnamed protein product, partial [marine sediment metagenome]
MSKRHITVFSFHDGHDAGAALIRDGDVLAAIQEERLNNIKHYAGLPVLSMNEVFRVAHIEPSEVDLIAVVNLVRASPPRSKKTPSEDLPKEKLRQSEILRNIEDKKLSHELFTVENDLVFTADGAGDGLSSTVSICKKGEIQRIAASTYFDSLGNAFYGMITSHLGLKPWHDEYKTMGLAPYGKPQRLIDKMRRIIILNPDKP